MVSHPDGNDLTGEIKNFARMIGLDRAAPNRYSYLLLVELYGGFLSGHRNPDKIIREIRSLENIDPPSQLKPAIQNKYPPLKGLWHKHYAEDGIGWFARNIQKGLKRYGIPRFDQMIAEAEAAGETRYITEEHIPALTADVVSGNYARLASDEALTGEWIVYAQYKQQNYYLSLTTHDKQEHEKLRKQIDAVCCVEFPFLTDLLNAA